MKKFLLPLLFVLYFSCDEIDKCGDITQKYIQDGKYYFVIIVDSGSSGGVDENPGGGVGYADAEVNLETYNSFNVGDEFCRN
mgnify:FL=1